MPIISVVMSVYNDAERVETSVSSILKQTFTDFEFIIINDGSTDGTGEILDRLAGQDARIRVIHQENTGLTKALIRGCAEAKGEFIARQDAGGDTSLRQRFQLQLDFLRSNPDVSLVACSASFVGPNNEFVYSSEQSGYALEKGLVLDIDKIKGPPHHGGTMFQKKAYELVGGYRPVFYVAQDIDLWLRLAEVGHCFCLAKTLYQAVLDHKSITSNKSTEQFVMGELAIESAKQRRAGISDEQVIRSFVPYKKQQISFPENIRKSKFYYFLGACLGKTNPFLSRKYFFFSFLFFPFNLKSLLRSVTG
jgi:glycosyltransferase involved in cell wall biosynthesis